MKYEELPEDLQKNGQELLVRLEKLRGLLGVCLYVNTYHLGGTRTGAGYRDEELNKRVGGVLNSLHKKFLAADVALAYTEKVVSLQLVAHVAREVGFTEIIIYDAKNFVHVGLE